MRSFLGNSSLPASGHATFGSWHAGSKFGSGGTRFKLAAGKALKFLVYLPALLVMALFNLAAFVAAVVLPILLFSLALIVPVLIISGLILATGLFLQLLGVG